jgi:hypothetical protein
MYLILKTSLLLIILVIQPSISICKLVNGCKELTEIKKPVQLTECQKLHPRSRCDSIDNARKCNSIEYCHENIWSKLKPMILNEKYTTNETPNCGFCIWIFNQLHETLQQNLTQVCRIFFFIH